MDILQATELATNWWALDRVQMFRWLLKASQKNAYNERTERWFVAARRGWEETKLALKSFGASRIYVLVLKGFNSKKGSK